MSFGNTAALRCPQRFALPAYSGTSLTAGPGRAGAPHPSPHTAARAAAHLPLRARPSPLRRRAAGQPRSARRDPPPPPPRLSEAARPPGPGGDARWRAARCQQLPLPDTPHEYRGLKAGEGGRSPPRHLPTAYPHNRRPAAGSATPPPAHTHTGAPAAPRTPRGSNTRHAPVTRALRGSSHLRSPCGSPPPPAWCGGPRCPPNMAETSGAAAAAAEHGCGPGAARGSAQARLFLQGRGRGGVAVSSAHARRGCRAGCAAAPAAHAHRVR